jgi:hypothetical protein
MKEIDPNIQPLVQALMCLPGVHTFSSCGGHKGAGLGQAEQGSFYVAFDVARNHTGFKALAIIQSSIQAIPGWDDNLQLIAWADPGDASLEGIHFELKGCNTKPELLAAVITNAKHCKATRYPAPYKSLTHNALRPGRCIRTNNME